MSRILLILTIAAFSIASFSCAEEAIEQEKNKEIVNRFAASINAADWDALDALLSEDFRRHCQATPEVQVDSRAAFKELQRSFQTSMPDQHIAVEMLIAEGDKVAAYATYSGTQTGPMGEFPITDKSVSLKFLSIFRIEDGRIAELWVEWDNVAMLKQLGLFPPPATPGD